MTSNASEQNKQELRNDLDILTEPGQGIQLENTFYELAKQIVSEMNIEAKNKCRSDRWKLSSMNGKDKFFKVYKVS